METMEKNNLQQKLLRIEHEWLELHVRAYLKDGLAYTIRLWDGTEIHEAVFHFDTVFEKHHFFKVGVNCTYPIVDVYCHSLEGHPASPVPEPVSLKSDSDQLIISNEVSEVIEVATTPSINPEMFRRRVKCLMLSGLPQEEAEKFVAGTPQKLELFYDISLGAFAIDAEAVGNTPLYNPYTGKEIPEEKD